MVRLAAWNVALVRDTERAWDPAHPGGAGLLEWIGLVAPWLLLAALGAAVVVALLRQSRYRAVDVLTTPDQERVHQAIREVERRTVGEVLPVLVERSDEHASADWLSALVLTLTGTALLAGVLPWHDPALVIAAQLALGGLGFALARTLPDYKQRFVGRARKAHVAEEQALQEFYVHGLHETEGATGVLLFVSLLEHRVVVLADAGIAAKVENEHWQKVDEAILGGITDGSLASGLVAGVQQAGDVLAELFPWKDGDRNEVPDRLIVRRE